jgi:alginate O-acetyltransferase complex protein AlgI
MLFNSLEFLLFFPIVTAIYFLLPHRFRWLHLLLSSCVFYMFFIPVYIAILFFTIIIDYFAGIYIEKSLDPVRRRNLLILSIIANVGVLCVFKYYNFFIENVNDLMGGGGENSLPLLSILLPIGLSFHTFQAMSYTIEVYRQQQKAEKHFGVYALYVMFYPQLVAGPIERPQNIIPQFHEKKEFDYQNFREGLLKMLWGFFKKVVIADRLAVFVNTVYGDLNGLSGAPLAVATLFFAIQIYCDFSGYSDIAIGSAKVMGFDLMTNFNRPYFSKSIAEFWRRWHISLSTWFRDYVYIPLGGNRVATARKYFNIMLVFLLSGLWHGASWNFLFWGAIHGFYQIGESVIKPIRTRVTSFLRISTSSILYRLLFSVFTLLLVSFAWIFFRAKNFSDAKYVVMNLCDLNMIDFSNGSLFKYGLDKADFIAVLIVIALLFFIEFWQRNTSLKSKIFQWPLLPRWTVYVGLALIIIFLGKYENYSDSKFIYFQF